MSATDAAAKPVGPRHGVELELRNLWAHLLSHRNFGVHDNFFVLGGNSIQALHVLSEVAARFGYQIPYAEFQQAPTIAGLAMLMRGNASPDPSPLVPIQATGDLSPLFCFHPLGGSVAQYFALARALGPDQPVYGLQALGLYDEALAQDSMTVLADTYASAVLATQPEGPYALLGHSIGGAVAFATARVIAARTGAIALLVLIDTELSLPDERAEIFAYRALAEYAMNIDFEPADLAGLAEPEALGEIHRKGVAQGLFRADFPVSRLTSIYRTVTANLRAAEEFRPDHHPGHLVLFRAGAPAPGPSDLGWGRHAATTEVHFVGLSHILLMERKGVTRMTPALRAALDRGRRE